MAKLSAQTKSTTRARGSIQLIGLLPIIEPPLIISMQCCIMSIIASISLREAAIKPILYPLCPPREFAPTHQHVLE
jgi:hypothetical protein